MKNLINNFKTFVAKNPAVADVIIFSAITYGFHLFWRTFTGDIHAIDWFNDLAVWLSDRVFEQAVWVNRHIFGLEMVFPEYNTLVIPDQGYVHVNISCSGLKQFFQAIVLFLLFPGPWKHKLWYMPLSIVVMHAMNVFRIVALSLTIIIAPRHWDFTHDWIVRPMFYVVLFLLWVVWVEYFRNPARIRK